MKLYRGLKSLGIASLVFLNSYASLVGCNSNVAFQDSAQSSKQQEVYKNGEAGKNPSKKLEELVNTQTQQPAQTLKPIRMSQIPANVLTVGEQGVYSTILDAVNHAPEGYDVWVSGGTYLESGSVRPRNNVRLLGGYAKDFSRRNVKEFPTVLDGNGVYRSPCIELGGINTVDGFIIQKCNSLDASAILMYQSKGSSGVFTVTNNVIRNNLAGDSGEGPLGLFVFYDANTILNLSGNEIHDNVGGRGTGVYIVVDGAVDGGGLTAKLDATIESNKIYSNTNQSFGGGVSVLVENKAQANMVIRNNKIADNQSGSGAGIYVGVQNAESQLSLVMEDNYITGNKASVGGGGVEISNNSNSMTAMIRRNLISKNQTVSFGGGLALFSLSVNPPTIEVSGNVFSNNISGPGGGAIYKQGNLNLNLSNDLLVYNTASGNAFQEADGGALYIKGDGLVNLTNVTVYGNKALGRRPHGGGAYLESYSVIRNSILRGNLLEATLVGYGKDLYAASNVSSSYSNIEGVMYSDGAYLKPDGSFTSSDMVNVDPGFDNLVSFVLSGGSPMVDAGDPLVLDGCGLLGMGAGRSDVGYTGGDNCNVRIPVVKGDVNGDGRVCVKDEVLVQQVLSGGKPLGIRPDYATSGADVDGDGKISMMEAIYILQKKAGKR